MPLSTEIPGDDPGAGKRQPEAGLLRPLIWLVLGVAFYWALRELFGKKVSGHSGPKSDTEEMVRDPQCGVYLPVGSALKKRVRGETVYFCSRQCEEEYNRKP